MLRHSGLLQLNFYGSCTPESFTHPITLMRFQRGKATIENIKSFLQSIQSCTCQKKINACLLAEIFILTSIWRLAISEDLAASAAEKQHQLRIRAVWLNSSTSTTKIRMIRWHDFCHDLLDPAGLILAFLVQQLQFFLKIFIVHLNGFSDEDQLIVCFLHSLFVH